MLNPPAQRMEVDAFDEQVNSASDQQEQQDEQENPAEPNEL